jgi:hypothetical protein
MKSPIQFCLHLPEPDFHMTSASSVEPRQKFSTRISRRLPRRPRRLPFHSDSRKRFVIIPPHIVRGSTCPTIRPIRPTTSSPFQGNSPGALLRRFRSPSLCSTAGSNPPLRRPSRRRSSRNRFTNSRAPNGCSTSSECSAASD